MNKTNNRCPRCHSDKLYKFGFDKQANQKYQCKNVSVNLSQAMGLDHLK